MRCAVQDSRSMPMASTSTGILPTAWVASVWKMIPFSLARRPIAGMSWIVPISLLANITEMRMVLSVLAVRIPSTSTRPSGCTGTYVTETPCRSSRLNESRLARCSMTVLTMCVPFSRYISATPLRARLIASVPPEVKTSSLGSRAPISAASLARQRVAPLRSIGAHDETLLGEPLEDLGHQLGRDRELLGDPLGAHRAEAVGDGDIMNRHQPVIGALGEAKHLVSSLPFDFSVSPTVLIGDYFSRILPPDQRDVNGKGSA